MTVGFRPPLPKQAGPGCAPALCGPDLETAGDGLVQPGQAAAADPDGLNVHAWHGDLQPEFERPIGAELRLAVLE